MIETQPEEDEAEIDEQNKKRRVVTLSTILKAKGLPLPVVILPGVDRALIHDGKKPDFLIDFDGKSFALGDIRKNGEVTPKHTELLDGYFKRSIIL